MLTKRFKSNKFYKVDRSFLNMVMIMMRLMEILQYGTL